ncbi:MAG TPA: M48 family metalloprotease, partial [Thermoanaerobaculia bacterium]|nr:M48 family metalloprotease [Thermoanaerobaculia bacterium]
MTGASLFEQQKKNLRRTTGILAGFVAFLVFLGAGADLFLYGSGAGPAFPVATIGALLFGAGSSLWALKAGDRAVLESANAVPVDPRDPRQRVLDNVVEEMAIAGGLPKPAVYVIPDGDPNAFATGSGPEKSSVAVTAGLLDALNREELQGVVSHEMAHVKNYDIRLMTVVAALVGSVLLISDWGRRGIGWGGGRRRGSRGGGIFALVFFVLWIVSLLLAPLIARLVAMAVSREREYLADASGSELTRNPLALASALEKIDAAVAPTPSIKQGVAHLCIADPRGREINEREGGLAELFATHPPIAKRIALLREMSYQ